MNKISIYDRKFKVVEDSLKHEIIVSDNAIYINGNLVDPDVAFIRDICDKEIGEYIGGYSRILSIDITSHCDVKCEYCYYPVDNKVPHKSIESILKIAAESGYNEISLMGAEPTMHPELPEIIRRLVKDGFKVGIITNGNKLKDINYLLSLKDAGLSSLSYSMHLGKSFNVNKSRVEILKNIRDSGVELIQLAFTINYLDDIDKILPISELLRKVKLRPKQLSIRAGAGIGACKKDSGLFMSDMIKRVESLGGKVMRECGNNLYFCELRYKNQQVHLARWPRENEALPYSLTGPALATPSGIALSPMAQIMYAHPDKAVTEVSQRQLENKNVLFENKSFDF